MRLLRTVGIVPVKELLGILIVNSFIRVLRNDGMLPVRRFPPKYNSSKFVFSAMTLGIEPSKLLRIMARDFSPNMLPIILGIVPPNLLSLNCKTFKFDKLPKVDGKLPISLFEYKYNISRVDKLPRAVGTDPLRQFSDNFKNVSFVNKVIEVGMEPVSRF